jgi:tetratricopeptide (TPR) repeat protein
MATKMSVVNYEGVVAILWRKRSLILAALFVTTWLMFHTSLLFTALRVNIGYYWLNQAAAGTAVTQTGANAEKFLKTAVGDLPQLDSTVWRGLGYARLWRQDESSALDAWRKVGDEVDMVAEMYHWAKLNAARGQTEEAWQWYERAINLNRNIADTWYFAARFLENEGEINAAADYYRTGYATGQFGQVGISDVTLRLGRLAFLAESWSESDLWLNLTLSAADFRQGDRTWEAYYTRGESWRLRGDLTTAAPDFQWVVDYRPDHYWAHIRLAQVRWLVEDRSEEAEALLQKAITISPNQKWAYKILGDLYRQEQNPEAITMYHLALEQDPADQAIQRALQELGQDAN